MVGFQIARSVDNPIAPISIPTDQVDSRSEQHNFILVRVDSLNSSQPKLISVWFASIFFIQENPSTLTLAQIYPPTNPSPKSLGLEQTFALSEQGEPIAKFWDALRRYDLNWEGYLLFDTDGANTFLQWLVGPNDFMQALDEAAQNSDKSRIMAEQTCQSIAEISTQPISAFNWSEVVPSHFRTDLRLENSLSFWDRLTNSGLPVYCDFLPSP